MPALVCRLRDVRPSVSPGVFCLRLLRDGEPVAVLGGSPPSAALAVFGALEGEGLEALALLMSPAKPRIALVAGESRKATPAPMLADVFGRGVTSTLMAAVVSLPLLLLASD